MSILSSLKEERRLSMKHWRYRLLHWAFGVEGKRPEETGLPHFLYTHYCPLFHLTNLIAIISPVILFFKIVVVLFMATVHALSMIDLSGLAPVFAWLGKLVPKIQWRISSEDVVPEKPSRSKAEERSILISTIVQ